MNETNRKDIMSMDHTPLEAVMVAAFGFDRPEGVGDAQNAVSRWVSDDAGISRPSRVADASTGRTALAAARDRWGV